MPTQALLDTNVLVYAASVRPDEKAKQARALALLERPDVHLCAQVFAEFYSVATTKAHIKLPPPTALRWLDLFGKLPSVDLDSAMVKRGAALSIAHRVSYWDGAILAAAERLGAKVLYTEDLTHGRAYGRVRAENPFLTA